MHRKYLRDAIAGVSVALAAVTFASGTARADNFQLGFLLDSSGSIGSTDWTTITSGLSSAMSLIPTSGLDTYEVTVVSFSDSSTTVVTPTVVTAGNLLSIQALITGASFLGSTTNLAGGIDTIAGLMAGSSLHGTATTYLNIATDGVPNSTIDATAAAGNAVTTSGVDNISIEGIGGSVAASYLQTDICYPQSCDTTVPYNFPTQGFYIAIADASDYADAIDAKVRVVTNQVPEPSSVAMLGVGLFGLGLLVVRRSNRQRFV